MGYCYIIVIYNLVYNPFYTKKTGMEMHLMGTTGSGAQMIQNDRGSNEHAALEVNSTVQNFGSQL